MSIVKKFKDWFREKPKKELIPLKDVKDEIYNILSFAIDKTGIEIYTYYEASGLTIEIKSVNEHNIPIQYNIIKEDIGQLIDYFNTKYKIYDDSFMSAIQKGTNEYINIPINRFDDIHDGVYFRWIDIYIDKYKK